MKQKTNTVRVVPKKLYYGNVHLWVQIELENQQYFAIDSVDFGRLVYLFDDEKGRKC